ncbi:sensor histidine kinase [Winogradskyella sp. SM1960]|uniref:tetratricopeptide repeat-containing sensor histidine kinase n=1 Tax=Winogradskyella sp. SM1960 TaxID=2865955 RepID=UPI001CD5A7B4|nr:sensor histidine kinase [Winogradskyella sp. SM1960]
MKHIFIALFLTSFQLLFAQDDTILNHGQNLIYENKLDKALSYYTEHLKEHTTKEDEIHFLLGLADIYKLKLDYDTANTYYIQAFEAINLTNNKQLKFLYHVKMAEFYRKRILFTDAVKHLDIATSILKHHKIEDRYLAKYYGRKAALFTEYFFIPDSTLLYAKKGLQLSKKINDKDGIFYSSLEISGVYENKKDYKKTIDYLEDLISFAEKNNLIQNKVDAYINYTRVLIKDKQYNKALEECLKALSFAKENELFYGEILFVDNIRNIYEKLGNTTKAYEYLELRLDLTDAYYKIEHSKFLFELEEKYKLTEKENQIKISNLEIENQNKALASNKAKLIISIGLLLAAIGLSLLIAYFLKKEKKSNKELHSLSQENEFLLSEANHRINNNLQLVVILISDQLKKSKNQENFQLKNILTKVEAISTLHQHLYKNNDKKKIDIQNYLHDVMASFFEVFKDNNIKTNINIQSVEISTDYAMYYGLLLTELFINSIKHAFSPQDNKTIIFELTKQTSTLYFQYSDNGTAANNMSIKPKLIDKLARQIKVDYSIQSSNGFKFSFSQQIA